MMGHTCIVSGLQFHEKDVIFNIVLLRMFVDTGLARIGV